MIVVIAMMILWPVTESEEHMQGVSAGQNELPEVKARVLSPRTPAELVNSVEGLTDIATEERSRPHIGTWLRVNGKITNISQIPFSGDILVHLNVPPDDTTVFLTFDGSNWGQRLRLHEVGDRISASGQIDGINQHLGGHVDLEECELNETD